MVELRSTIIPLILYTLLILATNRTDRVVEKTSQAEFQDLLISPAL